jgi:hypothetical protein
MMEAVRTSETSVDNYFTRQYNPEDSSEHHTRRRQNLKSHMKSKNCAYQKRIDKSAFLDRYFAGLFLSYHLTVCFGVHQA